MKMTLTHGNKVTLEQITAYAKKRQLSDQNRILTHARNVLVQREIRRSMNASLRKAESEHIGKFFQATPEIMIWPNFEGNSYYLALSKWQR